MKTVMRTFRAHVAALVVLALLLAVGAQAVLFALPLVAILLLLASGRYLGEERIHAHLATPTPHVRRARTRRWHSRRPDSVCSLFARAPRSFRGPPAIASIF
jgi:hypothetical protein